jgi:prephenate dehydrogenase
MGRKVKQLNTKEKLDLRNKAKEELHRLQAIAENKEMKQMIDNFKEKFTMCEIVYKVILEDHQHNKTGSQGTFLKIDMRQVPYALDYAGYTFEKDFLEKLFGSETRVGKRSVKKLRDALTHKLPKSALNELQERYDELNELMDQFLNTIDQFDN